MLKTKTILISIIVLGLSACSVQATSTPALVPTTIIEVISTPTLKVPLSEADVPRVTLEQARTAIESGVAIVVDVRSREAFAQSHIPGAVNIPLQEFETNITGIGLDKEQWIITYCT